MRPVQVRETSRKSIQTAHYRISKHAPILPLFVFFFPVGKDPFESRHNETENNEGTYGTAHPDNNHGEAKGPFVHSNPSSRFGGFYVNN